MTESKRGRILVVDDEAELMKILAERLTDQGYDVVGLSSGDAALALLREREVDLLLVDLMMPEIDGITLLRSALEIQPDLVGILMTGQGTVQTAVEAMKSGAFDYLLKPFRLSTLLPVVERALEVRRLRAENVQLRDLAAIQELSRAIALSLDEATILDTVTRAVLDQTGADEASVLLPTPDGTELAVAISRGDGRASLLGHRVPLDHGIAGWVAQHREPLLLDGAVDDPRFAPSWPRPELRSSIVLPLLTGGRLVGVLTVNSKRHTLTQAKVEALGILAGTVAAALESAHLIQQLRDREHRLSEALSDLEQTQQQLIEQERLRAMGEMASGIAHDFNNALAAIVGFSEILLDKPERVEDHEQVRRLLRMIHTAAIDASRVVDRLREFYRGRELHTVHLPVPVDELVEQAISLTQFKWKNQAQAAGATIRVETDCRAVPPILGEASELREALVNLITNAVDAMPSGGTLTLRTRAVDERVAIEVSDTGVGMTEEIRRRCLEPFFSTKGDRGTGLGLSMVHGVIRRHGGTLTITSKPGTGTTFRVELPAGHDQADQGAAPASAAPRTLHVLVVDDEPALRNMLVEYLHIDGHQAEAAEDGDRALELLLARACARPPAPFDLVITDRAMPRLGGDQLALAVKRLALETPVIMVTGFGGLMEATDERPPGVDRVLAKPLTLSTLRATLAELMGSRVNGQASPPA